MEKESSKNTLIIFISLIVAALLIFLSVFIYDMNMYDKENKDPKIIKNPIYNGYLSDAITNLISFLILGSFVVYTYLTKEISVNILFITMGLILINQFIRLLLILIIDAKQKNITDNTPDKFNDIYLRTSILIGGLILVGIGLFYFYRYLINEDTDGEILIGYLNDSLKDLIEHRNVK
jgi:hypothetical protein